MSRPVAVFDIDGTLFRSSFFHELVERLVDRGLLPEEVRTSYFDAQTKWLDRHGTYEDFIQKMVEAFRGTIKGVSTPGLRFFLSDPGRFPGYGGHSVPDGTSVVVELWQGANALANGKWGPFTVAGGAVVDIDFTV